MVLPNVTQGMLQVSLYSSINGLITNPTRHINLFFKMLQIFTKGKRPTCEVSHVLNFFHLGYHPCLVRLKPMKPFPWCIVPKTLCVFIFSFPTNLYCNKDKLVQKQLVHVSSLLHLYLRNSHCPFNNQCTCSMSLEFAKYLEINVTHIFLISKMFNMPLTLCDIKFCLILWNCTIQQGLFKKSQNFFICAHYQGPHYLFIHGAKFVINFIAPKDSKVQV